MQQVRVLLLSHMYPNPVWPTYGIFVDELARVLSRKCKLSVIAPVPMFPFLGTTSKYRNLDAIPRRISDPDFDIEFPRFFFIPKILKFTDWLGYFARVFPLMLRRRGAFDVIYVHWGYPDGLVAFICGRLLGKRVVLHVHGNESLCFFERSIRKLLVRSYLGGINRYIAVSIDLKEKLVTFYKAREESISVISNGIDPKVFVSIPQEQARARVGLPPRRKVLVTVARLSKEKRVDVLIEAFSILSEMAHDDVNLYIIGDGPERMNLESLVRSKSGPISSRVRFVGNVPHHQVSDWLCAADVFCLSSDREGCPVSVIEALRCQRPVVATRVGAVPDLILDDSYGLVVPPGQPQEFARALAAALTRAWDYEKIGLRGSMYSWEKTADAIMGVFRDL